MTRLRGPGPLGAILGLLILLGLQGILLTARVSLDPSPQRTYHDSDLTQLRHAMVLSGAARGVRLPLAELQPAAVGGVGRAELLAATLRNGQAQRNSYQTTASLWFVLAGLPPALLGISVLSLRLGPLLVLGLILLASYRLGRALSADPRAGLVSATAMICVPVVYQGTWNGSPTLGVMAGVSLALWALLSARAGLGTLSRGVAAGVLVGLATRWGESAGDGLLVLSALAGPVLITSLVSLVRARRSWQTLGGLILFGVLLVGLVELDWLQRHLQRYVLAEAGLTGGFDLARIGPGLQVVLSALFLSLLSPVPAGIVLLGWIGVLWRGWGDWRVLALLSSVLGPLLVLGLSAKLHDYHAAPMVPALVLAVGPGLLAWPALGLIPAVGSLGWLVTSWIFVSLMGHPTLEEWSCRGPLQILAADRALCAPTVARPTHPHWFRRWRRHANQTGRQRQALGHWLSSGAGAVALDALPAAAALVVIERPGALADVASYLAQARRPDILVIDLPQGAMRPHTRELLAGDRPIFAFAPGSNASLPPGLQAQSLLADTVHGRLWEVVARSHGP